MEGSPRSRSTLSHMKKQRSMSEVSKLCFEEVKTSTFITFIFRKDTFIIHTFISCNITFRYGLFLLAVTSYTNLNLAMTIDKWKKCIKYIIWMALFALFDLYGSFWSLWLFLISMALFDLYGSFWSLWLFFIFMALFDPYGSFLSLWHFILCGSFCMMSSFITN